MRVFFRRFLTLILKIQHLLLEKPLNKFRFKLHGDLFSSQGFFIKSKIDIVKSGGGNIVKIGKGAFARNCVVRINGSNNQVIIGKNVNIGPNCSFWVEGNGVKVIVGDNCTFTRNVQLNAQEDGSSIIVGNDCMFSNTIVVRTSDSHPIYDLISNRRTNFSKSVEIGEHVWIAPKTDVYKGVKIGNGAIIASHSLVTKDVAENTLVAGMPAKEIRKNIKWTREHLF